MLALRVGGDGVEGLGSIAQRNVLLTVWRSRLVGRCEHTSTSGSQGQLASHWKPHWKLPWAIPYTQESMRRRVFLSLPVSLWPFRLCAAPQVDVAALNRPRVLAAADRYLREKPITVTGSSSRRSAGGKHEFFSEGHYW